MSSFKDYVVGYGVGLLTGAVVFSMNATKITTGANEAFKNSKSLDGITDILDEKDVTKAITKDNKEHTITIDVDGKKATIEYKPKTKDGNNKTPARAKVTPQAGLNNK